MENTPMFQDTKSPSSLARDVYKALQSGTALPILTHSQELAEALRTFEPSNDQSPYKKTEVSIRNKGSGGTEDDAHLPCGTEQETANNLAEPMSEWGKCPAPVLMLEALSRKRLDAVQLLHEACPQLLSSIPLFDQDQPPLLTLPSTSHTQQIYCYTNDLSFQRSTSQILSFQYHQLSTSETSSAQHHEITSLSNFPSSSQTPGDAQIHHTNIFLSDSLTAESFTDKCPHQRSSLLLDLASEMPALLSFVLRHHPDVNQRHSQAGAPQNHNEAKNNTPSNTYGKCYVCNVDILTSRRNSDLPAIHCTTSTQDWRDSTDDGGDSNHKEDNNKENKGGISLDANLTNPIDICIHKNNPEVLQYLLFKCVWQNFLFYEIANFPHNSNVTGFFHEDLVTSCAWFLSCAALTGSSRLLHLILCGQFSHNCQLVSPSSIHDPHIRGISKQNTDTKKTKIINGFKSSEETGKSINTQSDQKLNPSSITEDSLGYCHMSLTSDSSKCGVSSCNGCQQKSVAYCSGNDIHSRLYRYSDSEDSEAADMVMNDGKIEDEEDGKNQETGKSINSQSEQKSNLSNTTEDSLSYCTTSFTLDSSRSDATSCNSCRKKSVAYCSGNNINNRLYRYSDSEDGEAKNTVRNDDVIEDEEAGKNQQTVIREGSPRSNPGPNNVPLHLVSLNTRSGPGCLVCDASVTSNCTPSTWPNINKFTTPCGVCCPQTLSPSFLKSENVCSDRTEAPAAYFRSPSMEPQHHSAALTIPDPNELTAVSLPVRDNLITIAMRVKLAPLHLACWHCDPASIKLLLNHGADIHLQTKQVYSPNVDRGKSPEDASIPGLSTASSSSSLPLLMESSSSDSEVDNILDDMLYRMDSQRECCSLSPLTMLALGIRSPPNESLSYGKFLGLVMHPNLSERDGQVDRTSHPSKMCALEAVRLLLDAGCDVNVSCVLFGKSVRTLELLLQPTRHLYHSLTIPRGRNAVLRCMELERMADIVLSACWELFAHGARLGPNLFCSMEWNLSHMDWMFLKSETLQNQFLHLAIFLGLFPPLDPIILRRNESQYVGNTPSTRNNRSQVSVRSSFGYTDVRQPLSSFYSPVVSRPSCLPWMPSTPRIASASSSLLSNISFSDGEEDGGIRRDDTPDNQRQVDPPEENSQVSDSDDSSIFGHSDTNSTQPQSPNQLSTTPPTHPPQRTGSNMSYVKCRLYFDFDSGMKDTWARDRQQRCLRKFANDVVHLSIPQSCLMLILRFLCLHDLRVLASITQDMVRDMAFMSMDMSVQRFSDAVYQAQFRPLKHICKLTILHAVKWRPSVVRTLPLPDCLKRYLLDPH